MGTNQTVTKPYPEEGVVGAYARGVGRAVNTPATSCSELWVAFTSARQSLVALALDCYRRISVRWNGGVYTGKTQNLPSDKCTRTHTLTACSVDKCHIGETSVSVGVLINNSTLGLTGGNGWSDNGTVLTSPPPQQPQNFSKLTLWLQLSEWIIVNRSIRDSAVRIISSLLPSRP